MLLGLCRCRIFVFSCFELSTAQHEVFEEDDEPVKDDPVDLRRCRRYILGAMEDDPKRLVNGNVMQLWYGMAWEFLLPQWGAVIVGEKLGKNYLR